jgi:hypothetical protein
MAFKMKGFKAHNMYKTERAKTEAEHDALEKKGYDHNPYKKLSPFNMDPMSAQLIPMAVDRFKEGKFGKPFKKETPCWDTHTNIVNGKQTFKMKGGKRVPDCKPK